MFSLRPAATDGVRSWHWSGAHFGIPGIDGDDGEDRLIDAVSIQDRRSLHRPSGVPPTINLAVQTEGHPPRVAIDLESGHAGAVANGACFARLRVIDEGCGIDEITLVRALEPFFTTKPVGQGTGLGLSVAYGYVGDLGGSITLDSQPGSGTVATILIPDEKGDTDDGDDSRR